MTHLRDLNRQAAVSSREREIIERIDEMIKREKLALKVVTNHNTPAWGLCVGSIDSLRELKAFILGEDE